MNIVCFWWGNWCGDYGPRYVRNLRNSIYKNTTIPHNFYCITDNPRELDVQCIKFEPNFKWNLNKLKAFDDKFGLTGKIIIFDLDTIILDNINFILTDQDIFTTNESFGDKGQCGGGIVSTMAGFGKTLLMILEGNTKKITAETGGSERFFYRKYIKNPTFWQRKYSGIYSYKRHCKDGIPKDAKIIHFHGTPRPHEKGFI